MNLLTKSVELDLKSLKDDGSFTGYGSVFNTKDQGGDIVIPGAFSKSLKKWADNGRQVPVLWQHKTDEPIGSWADLSEDDHGLLGDANLWTDDAPYARIAHKGMKTKTITGLSIGYRIKREEYDKKAGANRLIELDLVEISVVTNPMHDDARIAIVKGANAADIAMAARWLKKAIKLHQGHMDGSVSTSEASQKEMMEQMENALFYLSDGGNMAPMKGFGMPSLKEFEDFLRDVGGFSRSQAKAIAGNGLSKLLAQCEAEGEQGDNTKAILEILSGAQNKLTR